jgi:hypothetical protein
MGEGAIVGFAYSIAIGNRHTCAAPACLILAYLIAQIAGCARSRLARSRVVLVLVTVTSRLLARY